MGKRFAVKDNFVSSGESFLSLLFKRPPKQKVSKFFIKSKYSPEFTQWTQHQRFPSPKTREMILFESLPEEEKVKIHERWLQSQQQAQQEQAPKPTPTQQSEEPAKKRIPEEALQATGIISNRDPDRYKGVSVEYGALGEDPEKAKEELHAIAGKMAKKLGKTPEQLITDLAGGGGLSGLLKHTTFIVSGNSVLFEGEGEHIEEMERKILFDSEGTPVQIHNQHLVLSPKAPEGTGTRMLATQVGALKEAGGTVITTTGSGCYDCDYKGYYVWPLLGFESKIPDNDVSQMPKSLIEELMDTGGGKPFYISELMSFPEGREWWFENGSELNLEFFVNNDTVLQKYLQKKATQNKKTVGQFLHNAALKSKDKKEQEPLLTQEDMELLGEIWDSLKSVRSPLKKASQKVLVLARQNKELRKLLLRELVRT